MIKILLVEDEANLRGSLAFIFEREGFEVLATSTGEEALSLAKSFVPTVIVLDINLPGIDGFETCERLRRSPATRSCRIVMVTARAEVDDVVRGFDALADDYITKPFHPKVLLARIQALLRREGSERQPVTQIDLGDLSLDSIAREVNVCGKRIDLTRTEFDLLHLLATHPDRVFTRNDILDRVRGGESEATDRAVDFQVASLRKKLGPASSRIETVRGVGYKFGSGS